MRKIDSSAAMARALDSPIDQDLKRLLALRHDQLLADTDGAYDLGALVHIIVVEPNDTVAEIETAAGYPVVTDPAFEWVQQHSGWFEAVTILSDDGFGIALFVPDRNDTDPALLALLREQVISADRNEPRNDEGGRPTLPQH